MSAEDEIRWVLMAHHGERPEDCPNTDRQIERLFIEGARKDAKLLTEQFGGNRPAEFLVAEARRRERCLR